ncbi:MAG: hypothetical protein PHC50_10725 [Candidatus Cloacimonetes bacterium]|nr:hypothetical protein [Candidatus Cloacimonadota bacterium]
MRVLGKITLGNGSVVMYVVLSPAPPSSLCPKSADFGHKEDGGAGVYFRYCYVPQMISEISGQPLTWLQTHNSGNMCAAQSIKGLPTMIEQAPNTIAARFPVW